MGIFLFKPGGFWPAGLIAIAIGSLCVTSAQTAESAEHTTSIEGQRPAYYARIRDDGSVKSVSMSPTALRLDMNSGNSIKAEAADFKPVTYWFGKSVLNRKMLARISSVYTVPRIRTVPIVSSGGDWVVAEFFGAGSHIPNCRYEMLRKTVLTQYVLDSRGRVMRIADIGWQTDSADPRRTDEHVMYVGKYRTWIRAYDVDSRGDLRLVAAAWSTRSQEHRSGDLPPAENELVFGNVRGKQLWANKRNFEAALGLDLAARAILVRQYGGD
ncbi:hypothetical protein [Paraburkholderia dinghuensis]|uniref:Uncharacterized protein n=1 Tax=Paraburkholderia dinghuensis TaxID=2305225 RepID=A0A3N6PRW5_9BURK|nr:hypothetical protein [Paraburkholderia dinghuensis]RQH02186.1 hypothetical protein D1Y85_22145 [Paraburkholderia dinghuensis]